MQSRPSHTQAYALQTLRGRGATDEELNDLVRGMQAELLFQLCYLLEDPGHVGPEVADLAWSLVQVDGDGNVLANIEPDPAFQRAARRVLQSSEW